MKNISHIQHKHQENIKRKSTQINMGEGKAKLNKFYELYRLYTTYK